VRRLQSFQEKEPHGKGRRGGNLLPELRQGALKFSGDQDPGTVLLFSPGHLCKRASLRQALDPIEQLLIAKIDLT
jgi:hypothetical protein